MGAYSPATEKDTYNIFQQFLIWTSGKQQQAVTLQEDLSLEKKPISCRLHSADYDTSISNGACQKALPAAITETSGSRQKAVEQNLCPTSPPTHAALRGGGKSESPQLHQKQS
ncbi:hypothetical protein Anapl_00638 [Anas platyrhynchos]|uniref:Uncharacterized protein n=1 Tax=Anas platyrhynchos TaxID=8839 RepID=R0LCF9_ANAPL|nr:hypothetical protein Anapl_00638 [Anas platyrhynchos]